MKLVAVDDLPDEPLAAAGVFHQHWLPHVETVLREGQDVTVAFTPGDHTHCAWRRAAIQGLARKYAPRKVNGIAGGKDERMETTLAYLEAAPGVTGQYLLLHGD